MFKNESFKYLVEEEDACASTTEKLSNKIRKYLENKAGKKLSSEELMILSHYDFWCQAALKELAEKHEYKNQVSSMIDCAADHMEKQMQINKIDKLDAN